MYFSILSYQNFPTVCTNEEKYKYYNHLGEIRAIFYTLSHQRSALSREGNSIKIKGRTGCSEDIFITQDISTHLIVMNALLLFNTAINRRPYWWEGVINLFGHVTAFNQSDYSIVQSN